MFTFAYAECNVVMAVVNLLYAPIFPEAFDQSVFLFINRDAGDEGRVVFIIIYSRSISSCNSRPLNPIPDLNKLT